MACFQAGTNKVSSQDLGIDLEDKDRANWRKAGWRS